MDKKIKTNVIYNSIYQLLSIILPLITMPYISRMLGAENIGNYSYAYSIAYYFVIFAMLGLQNYGNRRIAQVRDDKRKLSKVFSEIYGMQLISAIISTVCFVIYNIKKNNILLWIMMPYVMSSIFDVSWFFFGIEEFKITVIRNIIIKSISTILIFLAVKQNENGIIIYSIIISLSNFFSQIILWININQYTKFYRVRFKEIMIHIKPNLILFIPIIAASLYKIMDKIMIGNMSQMEQLGYYENVEKIINVPITLIGSLGIVLMPRISNLYSNNKKEEGYRFFEKSIYFTLLLAMPMCLGMISVANVFIPIFLGDGYEKCINILYILSISVIFTLIASTIRTQYLIPNNYDKKYIKSIIYGALINLFFNLCTIKKMGAIGAAWGTLFAELTVCIYQIYTIKHEINIIKYLKNCSGILISSIMMLLILNIVKLNNLSMFMNLIIKILLGIMIYMIFIGIFYNKILSEKIYKYEGVKK